MKKVLCEPNRYEITVKIPKNAIKMRGKAEKPAQWVNFVSKWYVIHKNPAQAGFFLIHYSLFAIYSSLFTLRYSLNLSPSLLSK